MPQTGSWDHTSDGAPDAGSVRALPRSRYPLTCRAAKFPVRRTQRKWVLLCVLAGMVACAKDLPPTSTVPESRFHLSTIAKTDIDMVADYHLHAELEDLRLLMEKLYRRNPREWRKGPESSMEQSVARAFQEPREWNFPELQGKRSVDCMRLAFEQRYDGDRVLALIAGMATMISDSYNNRSEFFVFDQLDAQKLYNAARNVETAAWKLRTARDPDGELYLISNATDGAVVNLSFERLFGKIIAHQDAMAAITAQKTNRSINRVLQGVVSAVFLPI